MSDAIEIRRARSEDAEALTAIQRDACVAAFADVFPPDEYPYPTDAVLALWRETLAAPAIDTYVAEVDGEPAGTVAVDGEFLCRLYVLPGHWGRGLGTTLLDRGLERMRERGATSAKLWTLEGNARGRRFYERRGWTLTAETRVVPYPPNPVDVQYEKGL